MGIGSEGRLLIDMTNPLHIPVLLDRCIELLAPAITAPGAVVVDATLGLGGHSEALLERFDNIQLVGLDRDRHALSLASERLARFGNRFHPVHTVYDALPEALESEGFTHAAGILFDLGVSSMQLDQADRGFSYSQDAPLDMRMDDTAELTAARIIAEYDELALRRIFWEYGDEKLAPRYARRIVEERWLKVNDDGSGGMTLHELAAEYGVSAERIRQIEAKALRKLKHPSRSDKLRSFIDSL